MGQLETIQANKDNALAFMERKLEALTGMYLLAI
jgi:hypothetical protein